jgi:tight adherence protein C
MGAWAILLPLLAGWATASAFAAVASGRSRSPVQALIGPAELDRQHPRTRGLRERVGGTALGRRLGPRDVLQARLDRAGNPMSVEVYRGTQLVGAGGAAALSSLLGVPSPQGLAVAAIGLVLGLKIPDLWISRRGRARVREVGVHVPDLVELLVATTQAGLGPMVALVRSAELLRGPLGDEIRLAVQRVELGVSWRDAMREAAVRTGVPSLGRLVAALARSQQLGTSLAGTMRAVAKDLRAERRTHAEELARRAPIKMLFPLVFLILPAFLLLTVGPVVLSTLRSLH